MNLQNIIKIISALIGIISAVLLFRIIGMGDETIKMDASMGDFSSVSPLVNLALLVLGITVIVTLLFSLVGLASDGRKLKKALLSTGLFLAVVFINYTLSTGVETPMKDRKYFLPTDPVGLVLVFVASTRLQLLQSLRWCFPV